MMQELLARAVRLLRNDGYTCVICDLDRVLTSRRNGIAPLLSRIEDGENLSGTVCADKIIGKAAALLMIFCGIRAVHGEVMSRTAKALLEQVGIEVSYGELTDYIINRKGDGPCPMEKAIADVTDPAQAPAILRATLDRLKANN